MKRSLIFIALLSGMASASAGGFSYKPMGAGSAGSLGLQMNSYAEASGGNTSAYGLGQYQFGQNIHGPNVLPNSFVGGAGGYTYDNGGSGYSGGWGGAGFSGKWFQQQRSWGSCGPSCP